MRIPEGGLDEPSKVPEARAVNNFPPPTRDDIWKLETEIIGVITTLSQLPEDSEPAQRIRALRVAWLRYCTPELNQSEGEST